MRPRGAVTVTDLRRFGRCKVPSCFGPRPRTRFHGPTLIGGWDTWDLSVPVKSQRALRLNGTDGTCVLKTLVGIAFSVP